MDGSRSRESVALTLSDLPPTIEDVDGSDEGAGVSSPRCPTCDQPVTWTGNPSRPFCSISCQLVDLGRWLDGRFRVPGPPLPEPHPEEWSAAEENMARDPELGQVRKA